MALQISLLISSKFWSFERGKGLPKLNKYKQWSIWGPNLDIMWWNNTLMPPYVSSVPLTEKSDHRKDLHDNVLSEMFFQQDGYTL